MVLTIVNSAATRHQGGREVYDLSRDLVAIAAVMNRSAKQIRRSFLKQVVVSTVQIVRQQLGLHLSDFLSVLAEFVQDESSSDPDTIATRTAVASLLQAAATEAEIKNRELP